MDHPEQHIIQWTMLNNTVYNGVVQQIAKSGGATVANAPRGS